MVDLIQPDVFAAREKDISDYITSVIETYNKSKCCTILKQRIESLTRSNDLKPAANSRNKFISSVVYPIVKERSLLRRAIVSANYRATDIFNLQGIGATPPENAANAEIVLNLNLANTLFKMKCLKPCINTASKFGTSITYTFWKSEDNFSYQTIYDEETGSYSREPVAQNQKNAMNVEVGLEDYFQNPDIPDPDLSDYQGHFQRIHMVDMLALLEDETYVKENVSAAIDDFKRGVLKGSGREMKECDNSRWFTEMLYFEGTLPIKGNETCTRKYRARMIGKYVVRLSVDDYDYNISSYTVQNFDKRSEYFWGNPDSEYVVSHEDFLNTFLSMTADNALRSMMQYVFYKKDSINTSDIANVHKNNGFVPVDAQTSSVNGLLYPFQPGGINLAPAQFVTQMVNDSIQKMGTKVDLSRKNDMGGGVQNNSTATAANIIAGQSDVLESDILENYDYGVSEIGRKNLIMLQQFLSELFYIRPKSQEQERMLNKYAILGQFRYLVNTTASKNKQNELLRMQNLATWLLNITANPVLQQAGFQIAPVVRDILQKAELPSVDEIIPKENQVAAAPGMAPSNTMVPGGGGIVPPQMGVPNAMV